jgi:hypothetical protein
MNIGHCQLTSTTYGPVPAALTGTIHIQYSISAVRSLLQLFLGLPSLLLPWGFHWRACLVMLSLSFYSVFPSHCHLFLSSCWGCWPELLCPIDLHLKFYLTKCFSVTMPRILNYNEHQFQLINHALWILLFLCL